MKKAGDILATTFDILEPLCIPGTTTKHLSEVAEKVIRDAGGIPEEKGTMAILQQSVHQLMMWLYMESHHLIN
jgi:methionine aminopeptidase